MSHHDLIAATEEIFGKSGYGWKQYECQREFLGSFDRRLLQKAMSRIMGGIGIVVVLMIKAGDICMKNKADFMGGMMYMMRKRRAPSPQHYLSCERNQAYSECRR